MPKQREDNQIPLSDVARVLESGVSGADPLRVIGLEGLEKMRRVKARSLEREQARLRQKLGADRPRVAELAQKIEVNQVLIRNLAVESDRAQTEIPLADQNTWILYGYVWNRELKGIPNLTVAVYDQRRCLEQLGYACTDQRGYFKLSYTNNTQAEQERTDWQRMRQQPTLFVHVLNEQSQLLQVEPLPRPPQLGQVDYLEIILEKKEEK